MVAQGKTLSDQEVASLLRFLLRKNSYFEQGLIELRNLVFALQEREGVSKAKLLELLNANMTVQEGLRGKMEEFLKVLESSFSSTKKVEVVRIPAPYETISELWYDMVMRGEEGFRKDLEDAMSMLHLDLSSSIQELSLGLKLLEGDFRFSSLQRRVVRHLAISRS